MTTPTTRELPAGAYLTLAVASTALGLTAAALIAHFFILGLHQTEPDATVRHALAALGILFTVAELGAFYVATLLPRVFWATRLALTTLGVALLVFEVATVAVTQLAFAASNNRDATADVSKATQLRAEIQSRRDTISALRTAATAQAASKFPASRANAADQLRQAVALEAELPPLQQALAATEKSVKPTLQSILKTEQALLTFILLRAALLAITAFVLTTVGGVCLRHYLALRRSVSLASLNETPAPADEQPRQPAGLPLAPLRSPQDEPESEAAPQPDVLELLRSGKMRPTLRSFRENGYADLEARDLLIELTRQGHLIRAGNGFVLSRSADAASASDTPRPLG